MGSISDAAHAAVNKDKGMPKVDLGSGKRRPRRRSRSDKGPNVGKTLAQNINQAKQDLEYSVHPICMEVGGRVQGNIINVDSAAGLNAERCSNTFPTTHPLDKCQKTVQSGNEKSRGIDMNKADSVSGSLGLNHESVLSNLSSRRGSNELTDDKSIKTMASQKDSRFYTGKESSVLIKQHVNGVEGPSEIVSQDVTNGANLCFYPRPLAPAVNEMTGPSELVCWDVPYEANPYFVPHPLAPAVSRRSQPYVNGMAGPSELICWDVPYGANLCFIPRPFVPDFSMRSEHHVNGVEGPSEMMFWDVSYGANFCFIPRLSAPVVNSRRKLLVLDINGLLADIVKPAPKDCRGDIHIFGRAIFKRPFYYEFLVFCCQRFDVGIWSSRSKKVIDKVVDYLLGDLQNKLVFCWNMLHCTGTKFKTLENKHKPLVFKELRKLWEKFDPNLPWERRYYNESNTVLLDDSPYKALLNPLNTAIFPRSFQYGDKKDNSLGPGGDLRVYLEGLAAADDVRKYIAQHPFGQGAIDRRSPLWGFYSNVLRSCSVQHAQRW